MGNAKRTPNYILEPDEERRFSSSHETICANAFPEDNPMITNDEAKLQEAAKKATQSEITGTAAVPSMTTKRLNREPARPRSNKRR